MNKAYECLIENGCKLLAAISSLFAVLSEDAQRDIARLLICDLIMAQQLPTHAMRWELASAEDQQAILELLRFEAGDELKSFYAEKIAEKLSGGSALPADIAAILDECPAFSYAAA